ncbi:MAG: transposase, partial [Rhodobacter sp.]|nr:transposase [Rhodobacter sp.]
MVRSLRLPVGYCFSEYDRSAHCVHCHRYHIVWSTKYRHRVLVGDPRLRVRAVRRQVRRGNGVSILHGVLS